MRISDWSSDVCSSDLGRRIELNIAWIPADEDGDLQPDPVFLLAGGPGQSANASYPAVAPAFKDVLKQRGVVLGDQSGTGTSNPLQCKELAAEGMSDRKSVVWGKRGFGRLYLGGGRRV